MTQLPPSQYYDLPPHHSSSSGTPPPTFLVVLPSMTRGFRPTTATTTTSSRSNSLFVRSPSSSTSISANHQRDLSPSSQTSSSLSARGSTSSAAGVTTTTANLGWSRKEMTAKLLDGKNSLFSALGDAAGDRRRLSISALPMPLGTNTLASSRSGGGRAGSKTGIVGTGKEITVIREVGSEDVVRSGLETAGREEGEEDEEPGKLLGTAAEKLLVSGRKYAPSNPDRSPTSGGSTKPSTTLGDPFAPTSSNTAYESAQFVSSGRDNSAYPGSAGISPRGSIPNEISSTDTPTIGPTDGSSTTTGTGSTLKSYQYPPRPPSRDQNPPPRNPPALAISRNISPPPFERAGSSSYSPLSTRTAGPNYFASPASGNHEEDRSKSREGETGGSSAPVVNPLPPPFGGFRRSTSHRGEFPDTPSEGRSTPTITSEPSQPGSTFRSASPAAPGSSRLIPSSSNSTPPRARSSRRRPQTSSAALSGFGFGPSSIKTNDLAFNQPGTETDSDLDASSPIVGPGSPALGGFVNARGSSASAGLTRTSSSSSSVFPSRGERQNSSSSTVSGRKGGSMGSGRPGWEGDELVAVLREDSMQVTTLRTSSQMAQHLRHLTDDQATSRSRSNDSSRTSSHQVPLHVLLVPLSDSPTLPSLSLLLAQGTTPSAVCFQQDLLDRARRTEADWLPSALDMISLAARTSRRTSMPDANLDLPRLLVVAYSANPALSPTVVTRCIEAGAIGVLQPPYEQSETLRKIQTMIALAAATISTNGEGALHGAEAMPEQVAIMEEDIAELAELVADVEARGVHPANQPSLTQNLYASWAAYDHASRRRSIDTGGLALALKRATERGTNGDQRKRSKLANSVSSQSAMPSPARSPVLESKPEDVARTDRSASLLPDSTTNPEFEALRLRAEEQESAENETALAELLSEMYRQTKLTIDIQMEDFDSLSQPLSMEHRSWLIKQMSSWDFRPHRLSDADLFHCSCLFFEAVLRIDGLQQLNIDQDQLQRFLFALRAIYHSPNPYHNYVHAVDVVQSSYTFMVQVGVAPPLSILESDGGPAWQRPELPEAEDVTEDYARRYSRSIMRPQDVLAVMIGAMGHDVGHPGLSNAFMKNAKTPLAQVYEDKSVLENMHCMLVVQLLRKHGFGFLLSSSPFSADQQTSPFDYNFSLPATPVSTSTHKQDVREGAVSDFKGFKKLLVETVLATDMSIHFAWIKSFQDLGKKFRAEEYVLPEDREVGSDEHDRVILCQAIIKCADISNPTRPIDISEHWSTVLLEEWSKQASLEHELSLPPTVVASADAALQAKGQIGFIDLFTLPLFEAAAYAMPDFQYFADACGENRATWVGRLEDFQAIEQEAAALALEKSTSADDGSPDALSVSSSRVQAQAEKRHRPVFEVSTGSCLLDERYSSLFPMSLPVSLSSNMSGGYGRGKGDDESANVHGTGSTSFGDLPSTPQHRATIAPDESTGAGRSGETGRFRGDEADRSPAEVMRLAYRQSVRRQGSRQRMDRKPSGNGPGVGSKNGGTGWKAFGSGKGVEVSSQ